MKWLAPLALILLYGCEAIKPDQASLVASSTAPVERPRCDACHAYSPRTGAHRFHLDPTAGRAPNSCEACHAASIVMSGPVMDSVFSRTFPNPRDPSTDTTIYSGTNAPPWESFSRVGMVYEPDYSQMKDSVPVMLHARRPDMEFPEWMTRGSNRPEIPGHANGTVDVVIAEAHNERGAVAVWNPQRMTCSSVKCHEQPDPGRTRYVWKD
jgi:hypothetical protein